VNRRVTVCLTAFLVAFQLVTAPFVAAGPSRVSGDECNHADAVHLWHGEDGCDDGQAGGHAGSTSSHTGPTHRCHCVHVVALATIGAETERATTVRTGSQIIESRLTGPAFDAPLFVLLRPPN
jgi:hypothetical protein